MDAGMKKATFPEGKILVKIFVGPNSGSESPGFLGLPAKLTYFSLTTPNRAAKKQSHLQVQMALKNETVFENKSA
jgi:hypothetical protein